MLSNVEPFELDADPLDLNALLIKDPPATFMVRVAGESMLGAGIAPGDILTVDKGLEPQNDDIVLAIVDGAFTVKRLCLGSEVMLLSENPAYPPIRLAGEQEMMIWGVVTGCIKQFKHPGQRKPSR